MGPALGQHQYRAGRTGGVEQEIYEIRASMRIHDTADPDPARQWGIAALDRTNTFDNV